MSIQYKLDDAGSNIVYLMDGSAYVHRAYHSFKGFYNSEGMKTNAIFGFIRMIMNLINKKKPKYWGVFFDIRGLNFRHDLFLKYKANRLPLDKSIIDQFFWIKKILVGFGIPVFQMVGFEADDLIGTSAIYMEEKNFFVVVLSSDKDMIQLINDKCVVFDPIKKDILENKTIIEKFGIEPIQMIDVMSLSGDRIDNIPGIPGVGIKTALKLIRRFKTLENCYRNVDVISGHKIKKKLLENKEKAFLSRELVSINLCSTLNLSVKKFFVKKRDNELLLKIFKKLGFEQLKKMVVDM